MVPSDEFKRLWSWYDRVNESLWYKRRALKEDKTLELFQINIPDEFGFWNFSCEKRLYHW